VHYHHCLYDLADIVIVCLFVCDFKIELQTTTPLEAKNISKLFQEIRGAKQKRFAN